MWRSAAPLNHSLKLILERNSSASPFSTEPDFPVFFLHSSLGQCNRAHHAIRRIRGSGTKKSSIKREASMDPEPRTDEAARVTEGTEFATVEVRIHTEKKQNGIVMTCLSMWHICWFGYHRTSAKATLSTSCSHAQARLLGHNQGSRWI